jgi:hypothetical protein
MKMIEGKVLPPLTKRLVAKINEVLEQQPKGLSDLADTDTIPIWLAVLADLIKGDMKDAGLSEDAMKRGLKPVVDLMHSVALLYTDLPEKQIKEYVIDALK